MPARLKQAAIIVLKLTLAVGLIVWMVQKGAIDFSALRELLSPVLVLAGLSLAFVLIFINNYRWVLLLRAQGLMTTVRRTFPLTLIGLFFNFAMPGGVGGDVVKGYYLLRDHPQRKMAGAISVLLDRIIGLYMMVTTAAVALILSPGHVGQNAQLSALAIVVFAFFVAFCVFFALALSPYVGRMHVLQWAFETLPGGQLLRHVYESLHSYRTSPGTLLAACGLSLVSQTAIIVLFYLVGRLMNPDGLALSAYFFLVPVGLVTTSLPLSPGGVGVGQAAFYFLFHLYTGQPTQEGPTAITALQITQFVWGLFGAYFYLRSGRPKIAAVVDRAA